MKLAQDFVFILNFRQLPRDFGSELNDLLQGGGVLSFQSIQEGEPIFYLLSIGIGVIC